MDWKRDRWMPAVAVLLALATNAPPTPARAQTGDRPDGTEAVTAHTLRLAQGVEPPAARLADVAWLAGRWIGTGLGGHSEEVWLPPTGDRMAGVFTLRRDGAVVFHELMVLLETEGSLKLRLRHFNADLTAWEEKASTGVAFPLVRVEPGRLWLRGLTFERLDDDRLRIHLALTGGGVTREEVFDMRRAPLDR